MKKILLLFVLLCTSALQIQAQDSYNLRRAFESLGEEDLETAQKYLDKELEEHPQCALALELKGYIFSSQNDYGSAIRYFNQAISSAKKKEKKVLQMAYYHRAAVHAAIKDTLKSISDYKMAIKLNGKDKKSIGELADLYFWKNDFDKSDDLYKSVIKIDESDIYPYYGLIRNAYTQKKYKLAEELLDKVSLIDNNLENVYTMKLRVAFMQEKWEEALDFAVNTLIQNKSSEEAYEDLFELSTNLKEKTFQRIIKQSFEEPENLFWKYLLAQLYDNQEEYQAAINEFQSVIKQNSEYKYLALYWCASSHSQLGHDEEVIRLMEEAEKIETEDPDLYMLRGRAKRIMGDLSGAEADFTQAMKCNKNYAYFAYFDLAVIQEKKGQYDQALESYDLSIALNNDWPMAYLYKGRLLKKHFHKNEEAEKAFKKCIETDAGISSSTCKQFAYLALGDHQKAIAVNDSILNKYADKDRYYNSACLYSLMKNQEKALAELKTALDKGYRRMNYIAMDPEIDFIRDCTEFKSLIQTYQEEAVGKPSVSTAPKEEVARKPLMQIPLRTDGNGTYYIQCKINELPLEFILDTGCTDITLSATESLFMLKNNYLNKNDFKGDMEYQDASGDVETAQQIILREVQIGDLKFNDVKASIVKNYNAPILLGQNILSKFGKLEIDHTNNLLNIYSLKE